MNGWIGVDLDGTLAHYDGWKGGDHIGEPIPLMEERVKRWISEGRQVKVFTARDKWTWAYIYEWLEEHGMSGVSVTNQKDWAMVELWDDRAVRVQRNTGEMTLGSEVEPLERHSRVG